ncbi:MAG TPA: hypothetical protein VNS46_16430 [Nocardioides sp.]|nr:hypothetical protein [Nocardioides sp.]
MSNTHVPRRSGSVGTERDLGARQVLPPATPKRRRGRGQERGPELCGIAHPDLDLTCAAEVHYEEAAAGAILSRLMGKTEQVRIDHRGKHRARPLRGVVIRWDDDEAVTR